ncbi:hypothetical protein PROFUN_00409 [Planoprotostelium fungivorum]|uniref:GrpE protein homolog n=1 Tax=Planoprotostelium fungivorum TaxID=1890364 RepID=A0A2P6NYA5_9EUKA|nr:hypothetical protein PROFUN_00409 [Planoprotostelium fungivorum]
MIILVNCNLGSRKFSAQPENRIPNTINNMHRFSTLVKAPAALSTPILVGRAVIQNNGASLIKSSPSVHLACSASRPIIPFSSFHTGRVIKQSKEEPEVAAEQKTTEGQESFADEKNAGEKVREPLRLSTLFVNNLRKKIKDYSESIKSGIFPHDSHDQQSIEGLYTDTNSLQLKDLEIQIEELKGKLLFSLAERENVRNRMKKEVDNAKLFGISSFAKDLLAVADNLTRCTGAVRKEDLESNPKLQELYEGVYMTQAELNKVFKQHQLEKFEPLGLKFDPNVMNAVTYFPDPSKEGGSVGVVMKSGYYLHGRVLRAADVGVIKPQSQTGEQ